MIVRACCFRVGAFGNDGGRPQNGAASTGKLSYFSVIGRKGSNLTGKRTGDRMVRSLLASSANEIVAAARNPHTSKKRLCGPPACASNSTAKCPNGEISQAFQYVYDRFGNRWQQTATSGGGPQPQYTFDNGNNHVDGWSYDAEGNLLNDTIHSYTYDAENRIISVDGGATTYVYDAEGRRARKTVGGVAWDYLYDLAGHQLAEVGTGGAWDRQEVYAGGRHLATYVPAATNF